MSGVLYAYVSDILEWSFKIPECNQRFRRPQRYSQRLTVARVMRFVLH
jgi:hypothetical protein